MKLIIILLSVFFTTFTIAADTNTAPNLNSQINTEYVAKIKPIFQRSCNDCHSNQTKFPWYYKIPGIKQFIDSDISEAMAEVDFTNDYPFKGKDSALKTLENIAEELNENEMPPFLYVLMHKEAKMTDVDKAIVLKWVDDSLVLLKSDVK